MAFTEFLDGAVPKARKTASGFGVSDRSHGHAELSLKHIRRHCVDDLGGVFLLHTPTMPKDLASVKTSEGPLPQISWHGTIAAMDLSNKPFGDIAERLRWHRALEGLEQKEYAEKAGLKRSQLSNWESGDYRLSLDGARSLRRTYGLSLDFMFEGIDDALPMTLRAAWRDKP